MNRLFFLIVTIFFINGCASKTYKSKMDTIIINNLPSSKQVVVSVVPDTAYTNDLLRVTLVIKNLSKNSYDDIAYRFKWYDQTGFEVGDNLSVWKPIFLEPKDSKTISQLSPSPKAEKFQFFIKEQQQKGVKRIDPNTLKSDEFCYGVEELHIFVEKMVTSMLNSKIFDGRPVIDIKDIKNTTGEYIDTDAIKSGIQTAMIKSKRARFIDSSFRDSINQELEYQNNSKYIDKRSSKKIGYQIAPNYIIVGTISSIKKRGDYFYKITLNLLDIQSGINKWAEEKEVRKVGKDGE